MSFIFNGFRVTRITYPFITGYVAYLLVSIKSLCLLFLSFTKAFLEAFFLVRSRYKS